jgi:hypothetical protein
MKLVFKFFICLVPLLLIYCNKLTISSEEKRSENVNCIDTVINMAYLVEFPSNIIHVLPTKVRDISKINDFFRTDNFGIAFHLKGTNNDEILSKIKDSLFFKEFQNTDIQMNKEYKIRITPIRIKFIEIPINWKYQDEGVRENYWITSYFYNIPEIRKDPIVVVMDNRPIEVLEIIPFKLR